jgi:hypothetical protein
MENTHTKQQIEELGIEFIQKDDRTDVEEKYASSTRYDYEEFCDCCGRGIKGEPKFFINAIEPGLVIPTNISHDQLESIGIVSMGCYPIGSECKKKYPKEYVNNESL